MIDLSNLWRFDLTVGHDAEFAAKGAYVIEWVSWFEYNRLDDLASAL